MAIASQKPPRAHIPQWFQTVQSFIIFLKACGWRGGKNHEVPEQMTHCRQNDKAVSEQTGHLANTALGSDVCPFIHTSFIQSPFIHTSFIHSPFIHSHIQLSVPKACWALPWVPGEVQQNKRLFSPGPHSIRESGNGWERVLGVTGAVEGGCLHGEKVRTSEPGGGGWLYPDRGG